MVCSNCGKQLNEGARFCPGCGTAVQQAQSELKVEMPQTASVQQSKKPVKKKISRNILIVGVIVLLLVIIGLIIGLSGDSGTVQGGSLTITNIPSKFNGKYIYAQIYFEDDTILFGVIFTSTSISRARILNGRVEIPLYIQVGDEILGYYDSTSTGEIAREIEVSIFNSASFDDNDEIAAQEYFDVKFLYGKATVSFQDGYLWEY